MKKQKKREFSISKIEITLYDFLKGSLLNFFVGPSHTAHHTPILRRLNTRKTGEDQHELPMSEQDTNEASTRLDSAVTDSSSLFEPDNPKKSKKISTGELIMLTFFWTTGGPFGIERFDTFNKPQLLTFSVQ